MHFAVFFRIFTRCSCMNSQNSRKICFLGAPKKCVELWTIFCETFFAGRQTWRLASRRRSKLPSLVWKIHLRGTTPTSRRNGESTKTTPCTCGSQNPSRNRGTHQACNDWVVSSRSSVAPVLQMAFAKYLMVFHINVDTEAGLVSPGLEDGESEPQTKIFLLLEANFNCKDLTTIKNVKTHRPNYISSE